MFKNEGEYEKDAREPSRGGRDMTCERRIISNMASHIAAIILWLGGSKYSMSLFLERIWRECEMKFAIEL